MIIENIKQHLRNRNRFACNEFRDIKLKNAKLQIAFYEYETYKLDLIGGIINTNSYYVYTQKHLLSSPICVYNIDCYYYTYKNRLTK